MHQSNTKSGTKWLAGLAALVASGLLIAGCSSSATESQSSVEVTRPAAPEGELPADLQTKLQTAVKATMAKYNVPGAVAGVWIPGEGSWTTAQGLANVKDKMPASTDMQWPIRSITKSYTVTLLLQLVDEGKLKLDDTLAMYVDGVTNGDKITLLELANMSSGVADYVNENFVEDFAKDPTRIYTLDDLNAFVLGQPAQFAPGTKALYTNSNTNLLGAVIEKVTGQQFAEVLNEQILEPLGQSGTQYIVNVQDWKAPHPTGYMPNPETGKQEPADENPSIFGPAGSVFSTLEDGRVWADTLGSGSMIKPETQALREVGHKIPKPPYDLYAVGMGQTDGWLGHNGEGFGFTAATFNNPFTGASIVVYMNKSNLSDHAHPADQTFRAIAKVLANSTS